MHLTSVTISKQFRTCESCGHDIKVLCRIEGNAGARMTVGTECATHLLGALASDRLVKYAAAAAREWRASRPSPHDGEERADYINRRIAEKANARKAWEMWHGMIGRSAALVAAKRLEQRGIPMPGYSSFRDTSAEFSAWRALQNTEMDAMVREVETACDANAFDFLNRPAWQVK